MAVAAHPGGKVSTQVALGALGFVLAWPLAVVLTAVAWPWGPLLGALAGGALALRLPTRGFGVGALVGMAVAVPTLVAVVDLLATGAD